MRCLSLILSLSLVVATSSQACPDGWRPSEVIPNKCYYVTDQKKIWFDAEAYCKNAQPNAHLTAIASAFENSNVDAVVTSTSSVSDCGHFWIGGNDIDQTGQFAWVDGSPWGYAKWDSGQPDTTQQCVSSSALKTGQWRTEDCGVKKCFICEMYMGGSSNTSLPSTTTSATSTMTDCKDWLSHGSHTDGIYSINPDGKGSLNVFCDMTTDGGGWTVFQRRKDATTSFYDKKWNDYKVGFNNGLQNNLWLGNDIIHVLTTKDLNVELRIDLWGDRNPNSPYPNGYWWEKNTNFTIDDEANSYTLHLSSLVIGNATTFSSLGINYSNGLKFSTVDADHSGNPNCYSKDNWGGWWLNRGCASFALNGKYVPSSWSDYGFCWTIDSAVWVHPKQSRMMLRSLT
uniref:Uncharacterized protein n=1 Tax=Plectus sambesii TaxID=2011161 RepID=A0A914WU54_9BILA